MLSNIPQKLRQMDYSSSLNILQSKGSTSYSKYKLNNDLWVLRLRRKDETIDLLKCLPLKHDEKIEKQNITLEHLDEPWAKLGDRIWELREMIRRRVNEHISRAQQGYIHQHGTSPSKSGVTN